MKRIQSRLVLEAIAEKEQIEVTQEDIDQELENMVKMYQMELERLKEVMGENETDSIKKDIAIQKAVEMVAEAAKEI